MALISCDLVAQKGQRPYCSSRQREAAARTRETTNRGRQPGPTKMAHGTMWKAVVTTVDREGGWENVGLKKDLTPLSCIFGKRDKASLINS